MLNTEHGLFKRHNSSSYYVAQAVVEAAAVAASGIERVAKQRQCGCW